MKSPHAEEIDRAKRCVILHLPQGLLPMFLQTDHPGTLLARWRKTVPDNLCRLGFFYDHTEAMRRHRESPFRRLDVFPAEPRVALPDAVEIVAFDEGVNDFRVLVRHSDFPCTGEASLFPVWAFILEFRAEGEP